MDHTARFTRPLLAAAVVMAVLPTVLNLLGFSFDARAGVYTLVGADGALSGIRGSPVHTLLEWTAITIAAATLPLAYVYTVVSGSPTVLVMAVALFSAGSVDAFHILVADGLITGVAEPAVLLPFTWALSRMFNALILVGGVLLLGGHKRFAGHGGRWLIVGSLGFLVLAYAVVLVARLSPTLPQTQYPDALITRPFDVVPLLIYAVAGLWIFPAHYRRFPNLFGYALMVSMVPHVAAQIHMAFGSATLYDNHFNIGHALKIGAYLFPFIGLCLDYLIAHAERRASDEAKTRFLATMSHEMRTPLNAVIGGSELLAETDLDEDQSELVRRISSSGEALLTLVDDVLDLSRIQAGRFEGVNEPYDLIEVLEQAVDINQYRARLKGVDLMLHVDPDVPGKLFGDRACVRRVVLNLVDNAVKFTDQGSVVVNTTLVARDRRAEPDQIRIQVQDTGIGIASDRLDTVFERFSQADSSTTRRYGGSGLGLSISRALAELMGGSLAVESEEGVGSTFAFQLPVTQQEAESPSPAAHESDGTSEERSVAAEDVEVPPSVPERAMTYRPAGDDRAESAAESREASPRILVAEDVATNWVIVQRFLEGAGMTAVRVENGREAVELMATEAFDLVLMDIGMPEMDGYEATKAIRCLEVREGRDRTPIIALTAHARQEDLDRAIDAGCDDYLTKPVRKATLVDKVRGALRSPGVRA